MTVTDNGTSGERVGYIYVKAGRHTIKIKLTQGIKSKVFVRVDDVTSATITDIRGLVFPSGLWTSGSVPAKSITVNWAPLNQTCSSTATPVSGVGGFTSDRALQCPPDLPAYRSKRKGIVSEYPTKRFHGDRGCRK